MKNSGNDGVGGLGRRQTPNTCPEEHVSGVPGGERGGRVQQEGKGSEHVEHQKCASVGTFVVFDTKEKAGNMLNTKKMPTRACSWCST